MINQEPDKKTIENIISLFNEKKYTEMQNSINDILKDFPNSVLVNNIAGVLQTELKNYDVAKKIFKKVIKLNPKYSDGFYNLGNICNHLKEVDKAIKFFEKVIELDKNYFKAYNNLGNIYRKKNLHKKALDYYILSLNANPNYLRAYYNLAGVLQHYTLNEKNDYINKFYLYLLKQKIIVRPYAIAKNVINGLYFNSDLETSLLAIDDIIFPNNLNKIIKDLNNNELLLQFMKVCPIPSYKFEINFIKLRREILNQIYNLNLDKIYLKFLISLSAQCFLNEYIYVETTNELQKIKKISKKINIAIQKNKNVNDLEILILSCYLPLNSFSWCKRINPSIHIQYIYDLQFTNYSIEKKQLSSIKSISKIENHVSKKVKNQYEENPYPRWTNLGLSVEARNIKEVFKYKELNISLEKDNFPKKIEILVAGCGTGQHAITSASVYKNAKIYALDLSFNSLSYAKRKAQELGLRNMSFIQGDLLDLEKLNRKFDLIECVGVLHHMDDPFLGWKTLTKNIKNNSLMYIGLYSKKARENISRIRTKINNLKIKTTKENITSFRKDMIKNFKTEWRSIENSPDFYSTSGVRDLLFHVQEHQFTISKIRKYMEDLNLVFVGFEDTYITERFKKSYSNPHDLYNLDKWEDFEINNPRIFSGMYQFWCKKI